MKKKQLLRLLPQKKELSASLRQQRQILKNAAEKVSRLENTMWELENISLEGEGPIKVVKGHGKIYFSSGYEENPRDSVVEKAEGGYIMVGHGDKNDVVKFCETRTAAIRAAKQFVLGGNSVAG